MANSVDSKTEKARDAVNKMTDDAFDREFERLFPLAEDVPPTLKAQAQ